MTRVKRGNVARKRRKKILKLAKGFRASLSVLYRQAKPAVYRALSYQYRDRRRRKRDFRRLWIARINAGSRDLGISYSELINSLTTKNIILDRKILADLAVSDNSTFKRVVETAVKS